MRLGGRMAAAIEVLGDIEQRKRPVSDALKDWGLSHRFAGSGDRAAIGNLVYDALRKKLSHAWLMDDDSPSALVHAVIHRQWNIDPDKLRELLAGDRFAPEPLSEKSAKAFTGRDLKKAPPHVQADIPEWVRFAFEENFDDEWVAEAQALSERPPLDLRVNTLKSSVDKVLKALTRSGAVRTDLARNGLRIAPGEGPARLPNVTAEPAYQKGWFEVQDEGSQIVSDLIFARGGEQVLDYCAGGGGKTLALSAAMENSGQIHAYDIDKARLAPIFERLKRAGTRNVQVHDAGSDLGGLAGRMDRVIIDAPCTGTGTWRRRPDTKWKLTQKNLEERLDQQQEVLASAAPFVRPGGFLIYITCSVLPQENEAQVYGFCEDNGAFEPVSAGEVWQDLFGENPLQPWSADMKTVTLTPAATKTDGFFFSVLQKRQ
ncbi:RsmB/NOP family class I SAM-dependent RNA methyltransferase [Hoeflea poritis]|uniref:RsmB/NOP family class I SAM-dependent RNA methyltransferase n=1 Tax=Hoeflea poritis TaxID=2993659 RepID=A0ABT4VMG6_9HYPH|nr:RsmB/NOP family class I SAM-dependent RNA methyltransferase [Hoeflea poritis]MDA4845899.1 RsmB/NOP family class I SAM-dependent RNA methyltransferase [Hoeflea poritis]